MWMTFFPAIDIDGSCRMIKASRGLEDPLSVPPAMSESDVSNSMIPAMAALTDVDALDALDALAIAVAMGMVGMMLGGTRSTRPLFQRTSQLIERITQTLILHCVARTGL